MNAPVGANLHHRRDEPVAASRQRCNVLDLWIAAAAQGTAQHEHVLAEGRFFDGRVEPQVAQQFVLRDDAIAVFDEKYERIERPGCQGNRIAVAQQQPLGCVEAERTELNSRLPGHVDLLQTRSRNLDGNLGRR